MKKSISILWFRQDLRLSDNPALTASIAEGNILPIYILDAENSRKDQPGSASRWWLHHSLNALNNALNGQLNFYKGSATTVFDDLCSRFHVRSVFWNRCYEPMNIARDKQIKQSLLSQGVYVQSFNGSLLHEPWTVLKKDGSPYKVFTPYHQQATLLDRQTPIMPRPSISAITDDSHSIALEALSLLPKISWDRGFYDCWSPGEAGAHSVLHEFISNSLRNYKEGRDYPSLDAVSRLSPHLHFGEISPREVVHTLRSLSNDDNCEHFIREIRWREFSYYLLFHWPDLPHNNLKSNFDRFPWDNSSHLLTLWQQGRTGYPLVDAGMRELWQTGFMHNRVRMITASFLIKNLRIDWRLGADWFWDCLVDADLANNSASWQWVAGSGTDASPYFRIFNPVTQGEKFDADGAYTRQYLPELKDLPKKYLFRPWQAPAEVLQAAKVKLGETYPMPIVDLKESRQQALTAYEMTK